MEDQKKPQLPMPENGSGAEKKGEMIKREPLSVEEMIHGKGQLPIGRLWIYISEILRTRVFHMPQALTVVTAMVSAHLDLPIALFISAEGGVDAVQFLSDVDNLIPSSMKIEFSKVDPKIFYLDPDMTKEKVVVVYDVDALKSGGKILQMILERGLAVGQRVVTEMGKKKVDSIQIQGPTAVVALLYGDEPNWLNKFPAMRISLEINSAYISAQVEKRLKQIVPDTKLESARIKITRGELENLKPTDVEIPYLHQIMESMDQADPEFIHRLDLIVRLLRIVTIINQAKLLTGGQTYFERFGINEDEIGAILESHDPELAKEYVPAAPPKLIATKVEYYLFYKIAAEIFAKPDDRFTGPQLRVFEAVKNVNLNFIRGSNLFMDENVEEKQIIEVLDAQERLRGWVSEEDILRDVNKVGVRISKSTVDRAIGALLEQGVIVSQRDPTVKYIKYLYRINTLNVGRRMELPHPSTIMDEEYKGKKVTVIDILTGKPETI